MASYDLAQRFLGDNYDPRYPAGVRPLVDLSTPEDQQYYAERGRYVDNDMALSMAKGVNNIGKGLTGLVTGGQWRDTNPFYQVDRAIENNLAYKQGLYDPSTTQSAAMWGLEEAPTLVAGGVATKLAPGTAFHTTVGRRMQYPVSANSAELATLVGINAGNGAYDGNGQHNAAANALPAFGHNPFLKVGLNVLSEGLE